jgi:hypothetical protein
MKCPSRFPSRMAILCLLWVQLVLSQDKSLADDLKKPADAKQNADAGDPDSPLRRHALGVQPILAMARVRDDALRIVVTQIGVVRELSVEGERLRILNSHDEYRLDVSAISLTDPMGEKLAKKPALDAFRDWHPLVLLNRAPDKAWPWRETFSASTIVVVVSRWEDLKPQKSTTDPPGVSPGTNIEGRDEIRRKRDCGAEVVAPPVRLRPLREEVISLDGASLEFLRTVVQ